MKSTHHATGIAMRLLALGLVAGLLIGWLLPDRTGASGLESRQLVIAGERFIVELATDRASRRQGLMHRPGLPDGHGMLFIYPDEAPRAFWMKNVAFPIDILFLDANWQVVGLTEHAPPCPGSHCPLFRSGGPSRYVLELPAGTAERLGLAAGTSIEPPTNVPIRVEPAR
ncbi:DUF192 domain-containing protein [Guyparkeria sp.]|uniref:DUF192 domain-containing protein n=1 Tax=Guyparkeria sp. TaxID=2035736 RepID=UPI0039710F5B